MYNKEDLQEKLRNGIYRVTFKKINGEVREMPCTLMESAIPERFRPKSEGREPTAKEQENLRVFALESDGWRSFKVANVVTIEPQVVKTGDNTWTLTVQEGIEPEELLLPLPQEVLTQLGWNEGDTLNWEDGGNGSWMLSKKPLTT
jgi:hypothetical protein